jgi:hypothetical protein
LSQNTRLLLARYLLATGQSVILMCACKDVAICHRRTAAEQLAADL